MELIYKMCFPLCKEDIFPKNEQIYDLEETESFEFPKKKMTSQLNSPTYNPDFNTPQLFRLEKLGSGSTTCSIFPKKKKTFIDKSCVLTVNENPTKIEKLEKSSKINLVLRAIQGELFTEKSITIFPNGSLNGERNGLTYFGCTLEENGKVLNDHLLKINSYSLKRVFLIYHRQETGNYYIRNVNKSSNFTNLIYYLINKNVYIKNQIVLMIGEIYFQITPFVDKTLEIIEFQPNKENRTFIFQSDIMKISIGRDIKCTLSYPDSNSFISNINTLLIYDNNYNLWYVKDGQDKPSTNGTWLYSMHSFKINDGDLFKINQFIFKTELL